MKAQFLRGPAPKEGLYIDDSYRPLLIVTCNGQYVEPGRIKAWTNGEGGSLKRVELDGRCIASRWVVGRGDRTMKSEWKFPEFSLKEKTWNSESDD